MTTQSNPAQADQPRLRMGVARVDIQHAPIEGIGLGVSLVVRLHRGQSEQRIPVVRLVAKRRFVIEARARHVPGLVGRVAGGNQRMNSRPRPVVRDGCADGRGGLQTISGRRYTIPEANISQSYGVA